MSEFRELIKEDKVNSGYMGFDKKESDYLFSNLYTTMQLPTRYFSKTLNQLLQGSLGYCWAFAITNAINRGETLDSNNIYSPEYLIRKTKENGGDINSEGESGDAAFKVPVNFGMMLNSDLPYSAKFPPDHTNPTMDAKASLNKQVSYVRVSNSLIEMKQAILHQGAICVGLIVSDVWYKLTAPGKNGIYAICSPFGKPLGGHYECWDGFDDTIELYDINGVKHIGGFRCSNTWSGWGDNGVAYYAYDFVTARTDLGMGYVDDIYCFTDKITNPTGLTKRVIQLKINELYYTNNGFESQMDSAPMIMNSRTMVPVRFISEAFGYSISWNQATQTVTIYNDKNTVIFQIGSLIALVNGKSVTMDASAIINNNRTYVPLRILAEAFGVDISYENQNQIITLIKN